MKSLVIPDIHTKWQKADSIIKRENADRVICLGDYFDDFGDSPKLNRRTARWLKEEIIDKKNRIALLGNHEFNYYNNKTPYRCSGYSSTKKCAIRKELSAEDWNKMKPYIIEQGWYLTHAGISRDLVCNPVSGFDPIHFAERVRMELCNILVTGYGSPLFEAGQYRGGMHRIGGINWCDIHEFDPFDDIKQIFGHTPSKEPRNIPSPNGNENWCIDTALNHYAIIIDGEAQIKQS